MRVGRVALVCLVGLAAATARANESDRSSPFTQSTPEAGEAAEEHVCRVDSFVRDGVPLRAGVVRSEGREPRPFLLADEGGCPVDRGRSCQIGSPLSVGEALVVSHSFRHFVCAARTVDGGIRSVGWLPRRAVRTADVDPDPPIDAWPGDWIGGAGMLSIRPGVTERLLEISATALAGEGTRADAAAWLNGAASPDGQSLRVADEFGSGCRVDLRLIGSLVFASEQGACLAGARFDGVYTRRDDAP